MKKILYMSGHSRAAYKWGMVGEVVRRLMDDPENEVYYLDCAGQAPGYCGLNRGKHIGYCNKCAPVCLKVIKHAGLDDEHILKMKKFKAPKWQNFDSIDDAINYSYEGYNYGLGPVSCTMTITRDSDFDIKKWNKHLHKYFNTEYMVFKNLEELDKQYNFDEFHTFNGRMPIIYPVVSYARKVGKPFVLYERGANINMVRTMPNNVPHDRNFLKSEINRYWNSEVQSEDKEKLAKQWFADRREGKFQNIASFTSEQIKSYLPDGFDTEKENIVYFNSSMDEVMAFESWKPKIARTENEIIEAILEHYKNDETKHFYLRVHPNLSRAKRKKSLQMREIAGMEKKYKNLTVIGPDKKIDTYALMDAASKVITSASTVGCEATFWGNISILAGNSSYEDLDCSYQASSVREVFDLIDNKDLTPKPKENTYPFGYYYQVYGDNNKYWHALSVSEGDFMGLHLKDK